MDLPKAFDTLKVSIAAIVPRVSNPKFGQSNPSDFPAILATAFVIREDGLLGTNNHVIEEVSDLIKTKKTRVDAVFFHQFSRHLIAIPLEITGKLPLKAYPVSGVAQHGQKVPDFGILRVKQRGLTPAVLDEDETSIREGVEVAMAGFPMGNAMSKLHHCVGPVLQRGIVSQVFPYYGTSPHGFSVNMMGHGGASGSPIFGADSGKVIGINSSGLSVPANFSFAVPAYLVALSLKSDLGKVGIVPLGDDVPEFSNTLRDAEGRMT